MSIPNFELTPHQIHHHAEQPQDHGGHTRRGGEGVQNGAIIIDREIDRVYRNTTGVVNVEDPVLKRTIRIAKSGSTSTVVWNPWIEKSIKMPDFGNEEYHTMVCVEAANASAAADDRVLAPGAVAELQQTISLA